MGNALALVVLVFAADPAAAERDFLQRVEQSEVDINQKARPRIFRDENQQVVRLDLREMKLSRADFEVMANISTLEVINLYRTNTTSEMLQALRGHERIRFLNLTYTKVTDEAIPTLKELPAMKMICLGKVRVTPEGVADLRERFPRLRLGYSQLEQE